MLHRAQPSGAGRNELRYLRRDGNRRVRAARRRRTALRMTLLALGWVAAGFGALVAWSLAGRWATSPAHFRLARIEVRGNHEAREEEIARLAQDWIGRNLWVISLADVERKVREHPWIGATGAVRIQRKLPGSLVVTVEERRAGALALLGGVIWLLDDRGMPIDRYGPRYAQYDFPIVKGLDALRADAGRLQEALAAGAGVTRTLMEKEPAFCAQVSEIDVSDPDMIVLRLDGESYDLRLSRDDYLKNLQNYFALKGRIEDDDAAAIAYVDLRWRDRIAVMPAASRATGDSQTDRQEHRERGDGGR